MGGPDPNRPLIRFVALTAGALGIVQGLAYTIFSILCILIYFNVIEIDSSSAIITNIHLLFLYKSDARGNATRIVAPFEFNIFMYFYMVLSFLWLIISLDLWIKMFKRKWNNAPYFMGIWSCTTCVISILDIIFMGIIAHDFNNVLGVMKELDSITIAYVIVMTMAAKAYILLIINLFYAVLLFIYARMIYQEPQRTASIIDAYATSQRPWDTVDNGTLYDDANAANFEFTNKLYSDDYGNPGFGSRSQSFQHLHLNNQTNLNPLSNTQNNMVAKKNTQNGYQAPLDNDQFIFGPQAPEVIRALPDRDYSPERDLPSSRGPPLPSRTAKIGKQGQSRGTPPMNIRPPTVGDNRSPFIPAPDYTPPGSPKVKSVLRPRSNYIL